MKAILACAALLASQISLVAGHAILVCPPVRAGTNNLSPDLGVKTGGVPTAADTNSCKEGTAATSSAAITTAIVPGKPFTVLWKATIPHEDTPGVRIAISTSVSAPNFNDPKNILASGLRAGKYSNGFYYYNVTVPVGTTCTNGICTLQYMWVSTSDGGYYIDCADFKIAAATAANTPNCFAQQPVKYQALALTASQQPDVPPADNPDADNPGADPSPDTPSPDTPTPDTPTPDTPTPDTPSPDIPSPDSPPVLLPTPATGTVSPSPSKKATTSVKPVASPSAKAAAKSPTPSKASTGKSSTTSAASSSSIEFSALAIAMIGGLALI